MDAPISPTLEPLTPKCCEVQMSCLAFGDLLFLEGGELIGPEYSASADAVDSYPADYRVVLPDGTMLWVYGRGGWLRCGPDPSVVL